MGSTEERLVIRLRDWAVCDSLKGSSDLGDDDGAAPGYGNRIAANGNLDVSMLSGSPAVHPAVAFFEILPIEVLGLVLLVDVWIRDGVHSVICWEIMDIDYKDANSNILITRMLKYTITI